MGLSYRLLVHCNMQWGNLSCSSLSSDLFQWLKFPAIAPTQFCIDSNLSVTDLLYVSSRENWNKIGAGKIHSK